MNKKSSLLITLFLLLASVSVTICVAEEATRYAISQDKKQVFLAEIREDVAVLTSCLQPQSSSGSVKQKFTRPAEDVSKVIPSLNRTGSDN